VRVCVRAVCRAHEVTVTDKSFTAFISTSSSFWGLVLSRSAAIVSLRFRCALYRGCSARSCSLTPRGSSPLACAQVFLSNTPPLVSTCGEIMQDTPGRCLDESKKAPADAHLIRASTSPTCSALHRPASRGGLRSRLIAVQSSAQHQDDKMAAPAFAGAWREETSTTQPPAAHTSGVRGPPQLFSWTSRKARRRPQQRN